MALSVLCSRVRWFNRSDDTACLRAAGASTWQAATQAISPESNDPYLGSSCPFHCTKPQPRLVFHSAADCSVICVCLPMINSHDWAVALVISGCHTGWAERCAAALPSGSAGPGAHAANSEGSKMVTAQIITFFLFFFAARDVGQVTVLSPIAWKRRVNQQEIHQLSINCHFHTAMSCWVSTLHTCTPRDVHS